MDTLHGKSAKSKSGSQVERVFVTIKEAAYALSVSEMTVRRWSQRGILPPLLKRGHTILLKYADVLRYIEEGA